jgi:hypothetical protein
MTRIAFLLVAVVTAAGGVAFIPAVSLLNYNRSIHVVGGCTRIGGSSDQPALANKGVLG